MCFVGGVGAIAGVAMGFVALSQIKKTGEQGRGLAIGGIAVGAVELVLGVVLVIIGIGVYTFDSTNR
jgi:peptidyl-prolyl cis-trans isomerase B (cyclophilin B)